MNNWQFELKRDQHGEVNDAAPLWYGQTSEIDRLTEEVDFLLHQLPIVRKSKSREAYISYLENMANALLTQYLFRMRIIELSGASKEHIDEQLQAAASDYTAKLKQITNLVVDGDGQTE